MNSGGWQHVVTEAFDMFDSNYMQWDGTFDFISFEMTTKNMGSVGEYAVADFEVYGEDYTNAPSQSLSPSQSPTNLYEELIGYVVRYAGEVRTVIRQPFQVDQTGEVLAMDGSTEYHLCELDEVEGRKAEVSEPGSSARFLRFNYLYKKSNINRLPLFPFPKQFPNRMNLFINGRCKSIRHGNPSVSLDPNFLNQTDLHVLDLSSPDLTVTPINIDQTFGGDWLLETAVEDEVCITFPSPYDNNYRGGDPDNPDAIPTRFDPDKPVFAKLPDGSYALYDSRLILHENTLESPLMDGGATAGK